MSNLGNKFYIDAKPGGGVLPPVEDYTHGWYQFGSHYNSGQGSSLYAYPFDSQEEYDFWITNYPKFFQFWNVGPTTPNDGNFNSRVFPAGLEFVKIENNSEYVIGLTSSGQLWVCGGRIMNVPTPSNNGAEPLDNPTLFGAPIPGETFLDFAFSTNNYYRIISDGTLWSKGANINGMNGNNLTGGTVDSFTQIGTDTNWVEISAGQTHVVARKSDGTVWCWGSNTSGRTGLSTSLGTTNVPTQVTLLPTTCKRVQAGSNCTMVWGDDNNFYFWGGRGPHNNSLYSGILIPSDVNTPTLTVTSTIVNDLGISDYIMGANIFFKFDGNKYKVSGGWLGNTSSIDSNPSINVIEAESIYVTQFSQVNSHLFVNSVGELFTRPDWRAVASASNPLYVMDNTRTYAQGIMARRTPSSVVNTTTVRWVVYR
jgi:hypothetical protein